LNRLVQTTQALRAAERRGLAPYLTAGDGGLESTLQELFAIEQAGACCVELGVPFSDPIADGPFLQAAAQRALDSGTNLKAILQMLGDFRAGGGSMPIALMTYANPLYRNGLAPTIAEVSAAGADALIIPDLPLEEGEPVEEACLEHGLCPVFFAAPTSSEARIREAGRRSKGFLYVVGRIGVTGASTSFDAETQEFLATTRELSEVPIAVGFGIGTADHVQEAVRSADLAIVGTALVRHLFEVQQQGGERATAAASMVRELCTGLR
jgi:tryptophan synthase alpha chain